jgi:hypothetical protein
MWTAIAQSILAKVARGRIAFEKVYEARSLLIDMSID